VLADPAARGLVRRAILQSGTGTGSFTPAQADVVTAAAGRELGLEPSARALAAIDDERLVEVAPRLSGLELGHPLGRITPFSLVLDRPPADTLTGGVELLIGSNLDEGALYLAALGSTATTLGDELFGAGTRRMASAHAPLGPTYAYEFGWRSSELGASHVMELPFVFDHLDLPALHGPHGLLGTGEPPAGLAARMHAAWARFAATGDPGWPRHPHIERLGGDQPGAVLSPGSRATGR